MKFDLMTMMRGAILVSMFFIASIAIIILVKTPIIFVILVVFFAVIAVLGNAWNYFDPPER